MKHFVFILAILFILGFTACAPKSHDVPQTESQTQTESHDVPQAESLQTLLLSCIDKSEEEILSIVTEDFNIHKVIKIFYDEDAYYSDANLFINHFASLKAGKYIEGNFDGIRQNESGLSYESMETLPLPLWFVLETEENRILYVIKEQEEGEPPTWLETVTELLKESDGEVSINGNTYQTINLSNYFLYQNALICFCYDLSSEQQTFTCYAPYVSYSTQEIWILFITPEQSDPIIAFSMREGTHLAFSTWF